MYLKKSGDFNDFYNQHYIPANNKMVIVSNLKYLFQQVGTNII